MTDTEKERELSKEGMEMNRDNLVEQGEKKESSLAADQESVTGNRNSNNFKIDSSKVENGSSVKNEPVEDKKDESSDPPDSKISGIIEEKKGKDLSGDLSDQKNDTIPASGNDLPDKPNAPVPDTESKEDLLPRNNESSEDLKTTSIENSDENKIKNDEDSIVDEAKPSAVAESKNGQAEQQIDVEESKEGETNSSDIKEKSQVAEKKSTAEEKKSPIEETGSKVQSIESSEEAQEVQSVSEAPQDLNKDSDTDSGQPLVETKSPTETEESQDVKPDSHPEAVESLKVTEESRDIKTESQTLPVKPQDVGTVPEIEAEAGGINKNIDEPEQSEGIRSADSSKSEGGSQETSVEKVENIEKEDSKTDKSEEERSKVHLNDELEQEEEKDYSLLKKDELINEFESLLKIENIKEAEKKIKELKQYYQGIVESERKEALQKFLDDGGVEIDFKYIGDALDSRYSNLNDKYKGRRNAYYSELEKSKEENLARKQDILEKLRSIVDGEETNASIGALKNITNEWRSIGPVPSAYAKSMWATYNILIDRFYDNRSIYFELKELDRKKNLESKLELCEKAEHLLEYEVIRDAVKELNELHEEFKHIGPVPKDMQEVVWQRFKSASDAIYNRRKDYVSGLKKELHENLDSKQELVGEVAKFDDFDSEKISDWNEKTKEILDLQKKWEAIGGLPREHAKEVNKHFWSSFKTFFNNKNKFFKKLESQRDENLLKKEELVKRAEELKQSSEWEKTAEQLKELQREWKDIGPVPEKNRNEVYKKFKKACDTFFNKRREHSKVVESEYKVNLRKKEEICAEIEKIAKDKDKNIDRFKELQGMFNSIGFVPRNTIKKIQKKFSNASELFLNSLDLSDTEKSEIRFAAEVDKLKASPNADKRIYRKEVEVRRLISKLENDIALWKNNIEFFAKSKTADKVREEFNEKIAKASSQLEELKEELKVLNKI